MDKRLEFTGGEPDVRLNQITIDDEANRAALFGMLKPYALGTNPNFIISGCVVNQTGFPPTVSYTVTAGYIFLNNEIVQVDAKSGTYNGVDSLVFNKGITYNALGDKTFVDGTPRQTWQQNRGIIITKVSVAITDLDAISGDTLADKIKDYVIGETSTSSKGSVEQSTLAELIAGAVLKFPDCATIKAAYDPGEWRIPAYNPLFGDGTKPLQYRLKNGSLQFRGDMTSAAASGEAFVLPVGYRPTGLTSCIFFAGNTISEFLITTIGGVSVSGSYAWNTIANNSFNVSVIID